MSTRPPPAHALALALALGLACCGPSQTTPTPAPGTARGAIANGSVETGWAGVGALTWVQPGLGYQGSFCTGSLVTPQWVLTAAHCLEGNPEGPGVTPPLTRFYVGSDARPGPGGWPATGQLHQADAFVVHPDYDPQYQANDIALVHLAQPVPGATVYPLNAGFLTEVGVPATYVGFGATEGLGKTGGGLKRKATVPITWIYEGVYASDFAGSGTCFGDSGGPGFLTMDGEATVVGVNSSLVVCDPASDPECALDPCQRRATATRVDVHANWLAAQTGAPLPDCNGTPGLCFCVAACQAGGACDNSACQTLDCGGLYECLGACGGEDGVCETGCYLSGTDQGQADLDTLGQCLAEHCEGAVGQDFQECVAANCQTIVDVCFPIGVGPASCESVYECLVGCEPSDESCPFACYEEGTVAAQDQLDVLLACFDASCSGLSGAEFSQCAGEACGPELDACFPPVYGSASCEAVQDCYGGCAEGDTPCLQACYETGTEAAQAALDAMSACFAEHCGGIADQDPWLACVAENCSAPVDVCFPPTNCPVNGGGCPGGEACYPTPTGQTDCFSSTGKAQGAACSDPPSGLDCADGLVCLGGACTPLCVLDQHCDPGELCVAPLWVDVDEIGTCACIDADQDGACADVDCDDQQSAAAPGLVEACGDGLDNDCDGATDETCPPPTPDPDLPDAADADAADADAAPPTPDVPPPDPDVGPPIPDAEPADGDVAPPTPDPGPADADAAPPTPDPGPADADAAPPTPDAAPTDADSAPDTSAPDTAPEQAPDAALPPEPRPPDTARPDEGTSGSGCSSTPQPSGATLALLLMLGLVARRRATS